MDEFGIHPDHRFAMWDWVGGRYSIWSAIGVSLAIAIGAKHFREFLSGAAEMDEHFLAAPWGANLPALMGLLGVWNINVLKLPTLAVLPYDDRLARFPAYLQQLDMESNASVCAATVRPCSARRRRWCGASPATMRSIPSSRCCTRAPARAALDFLLPARSSCGDGQGQDLAIANCLAQARSLRIRAGLGQSPQGARGQPALQSGDVPLPGSSDGRSIDCAL